MHIGFITSNLGKLEELYKRITPLGHEVTQLNITYPELQADTIDEVAKFGIKWIAKSVLNTRLPDNDLSSSINEIDIVVLEDSGLFVHALNNFPGVYSKFVFKTVGYQSILELLKDKNERTAHFESCIAFSRIGTGPKKYSGTIDQNNIQFFKGICKGVIVNEPSGAHGFGYDPIFRPERASKTFAEMETHEKNSYSHRGKAMEKLIEFLKD